MISINVEQYSSRLITVFWAKDLHLTIKPEASQYVFVRLLLRRLRTVGPQTWQERRGRSQKKHGGTRFHGNH